METSLQSPVDDRPIEEIGRVVLKSWALEGLASGR
jgi:hypothetical protein